ITTNEGELRSMGLESELTALIGNNLTLAWNGGIADAEFTALMVAGEENNADHTGNKQLFSPDFTSNLSVEYNKLMGISGKYELLARAEWLWIGTTYFDLQNTLKQDPYHLANGRVGIKRGHVG